MDFAFSCFIYLKSKKKKARACLMFHSHVILLTKQNFSALPTSVSFRPASCFMVGCPERDDRLSSHINRVVQSANVLCTPLANPNTGGGISWGKNDCLLMLGQFCKLTGNILRQNIKKKLFQHQHCNVLFDTILHCIYK